MWHILERFVIHFFASASLVLIVLFVLMWLHRKEYFAWLPSKVESLLLIAALIVFGISTLREAYDVGQGQPLIKAFTDYVSWLAGCGVSSWGIYRLLRLT